MRPRVQWAMRGPWLPGQRALVWVTWEDLGLGHGACYSWLLKADIDVGKDVNIDYLYVDVDRYLGCLKGVSKSLQVWLKGIGASCGTDLDSSETAGPEVEILLGLRRGSPGL